MSSPTPPPSLPPITTHSLPLTTPRPSLPPLPSFSHPSSHSRSYSHHDSHSESPRLGGPMQSPGLDGYSLSTGGFGGVPSWRDEERERDERERDERERERERARDRERDRERERGIEHHKSYFPTNHALPSPISRRHTYQPPAHPSSPSTTDEKYGRTGGHWDHTPRNDFAYPEAMNFHRPTAPIVSYRATSPPAPVATRPALAHAATAPRMVGMRLEGQMYASSSGGGGGGSGTGAAGGEKEKEKEREKEAKRLNHDLTTKGRKRKRLAKACSACHKNKRRCDGFAPCSNCEFSSRKCIYVNSVGESIPPPRTRDASEFPNEGGMEEDESSMFNDHHETHSHYKQPPLPLPLPAKREEDIQQDDEIVDWEDYPGVEYSADPYESNTGRQMAGGQQNGRGSGSSGSGERGRPTGGHRAEPRGPPLGGLGNDQARRLLADEEREREKRWRVKVVDLVKRDDTLVEELMHLFFAKLPPYHMMFHLPTFHHRRYLGEIPAGLIDIMLAFAVRFLEHPLLVPCAAAKRRDGKPFPTHLRGEPFAASAKVEVDNWVRVRNERLRSGRSVGKGEWEETEWCMAIALIKLYEVCLARPKSALSYHDLGVEIMRPTSVTSYAPIQPVPNTPIANIAQAATLLEARSRTLWMFYVSDVCGAANGRPRKLMDAEMAHVMLPGDEASWQRWGGSGHRSRPESLHPRVNGLDGVGYTQNGARVSMENANVGEFGHMLRILSIFSGIMSLSNHGGAGSTEARSLSVLQHENALKQWALSLPVHLRFDESNLYTALAKLSSPLPFVSAAGWSYAYMHAVAESGMFYLQAAAAAMGQSSTEMPAQRQAQAVDNLGVILESIGELGRGGPLMLFPLFIVSNWQAHTTSSAPKSVMTSAAQTIEAKLVLWWAEVGRLWGMQRQSVLERGFYDVNSQFQNGGQQLPLSQQPLATEARYGNGAPISQQYQRPSTMPYPPGAVPPHHGRTSLAAYTNPLAGSPMTTTTLPPISSGPGDSRTLPRLNDLLNPPTSSLPLARMENGYAGTSPNTAIVVGGSDEISPKSNPRPLPELFGSSAMSQSSSGNSLVKTPEHVVIAEVPGAVVLPANGNGNGNGSVDVKMGSASPDKNGVPSNGYSIKRKATLTGWTDEERANKLSRTSSSSDVRDPDSDIQMKAGSSSHPVNHGSERPPHVDVIKPDPNSSGPPSQPSSSPGISTVPALPPATNSRPVTPFVLANGKSNGRPYYEGELGSPASADARMMHSGRDGLSALADAVEERSRETATV